MKRLEVMVGGSATALAVGATETPFERMRGLLGRPALAPGEALLLRPCNMVHTVGMRYAIDVVFVDRRGSVLKVIEALRPARAAACLRAAAVVELAAGEAGRHGWAVGSQLDFLAGRGRRGASS